MGGVLGVGGRFFKAGVDLADVSPLCGVEVHTVVSAGQDTKSASSPLLYMQFNQSDWVELSDREGEDVVLGKSGWCPAILIDVFRTGGVVGEPLKTTCSYR